MILADKIIMLRKKCGWSQEELAEKLNVSRQSVSKWEGAQSVPDLDKILQMSKIFGVTTDYLLKDEIEDNEMLVDEEHEEKDTRWVTVEEARAFIEVKEKTADKVAAGVSLCILSPVIMFMLIALSESHRITMSENTASAIGIISLIMIVTTAVALFVTSAMKTGAYEYLEKEFIETVTTAALLAPAAIMVGAGVDKAFNNPTTLKAASDIAGYGVANLFMGGNVSLIQTIIDLF